jgi:predicted acylesterase/phospholipase RssA
MMWAVFDWLGIVPDRVGGVSGGAPGAAFFAAGIPGKEIVRLALDNNFGAKVSFDFSPSGLLGAVKEAFRQWKVSGLPEKALISTAPLGQYVKEKTKGLWPARFWTVCMSREARYLMTVDGVWRMDWSGEIEKVADRPPAIEDAIAATTSIPLIMHGAPCMIGDQKVVLFDGGMADPRVIRPHKDCPVELPFLLYGRHRLIVFDVGDDQTWIGKLISDVRQALVHNPPVPAAPSWVLEDELTSVIFCPVPDLHTLKLGPARDCKWRILMRGFLATIDVLSRSGRIGQDKLSQAHSIITRYAVICSHLETLQQKVSAIRNKTERQARQAELEGELSKQLEELMASHGLY